MIPGVIAYHLYGQGLSSIDLAYPQLVKTPCPYGPPDFSRSITGCRVQLFNSLINSAATMLTLDVISPVKKATG